MKHKKEFRFFTIFQHEEEQEYLRIMHKAGWAFTYVAGLGMYHFTACTPEDVIYQLDYNKEGIAHKGEYVQMFSDCGWEYLQDFFGYSYFRKGAKDMNGEESIFCDDQSRLAMMERVMKGRGVPIMVIFLTILVPQFLLNIFAARYVLATFFGGMIAAYLALFGMFCVKYRQYKNRLDS